MSYNLLSLETTKCDNREQNKFAAPKNVTPVNLLRLPGLTSHGCLLSILLQIVIMDGAVIYVVYRGRSVASQILPKGIGGASAALQITANTSHAKSRRAERRSL